MLETRGKRKDRQADMFRTQAAAFPGGDLKSRFGGGTALLRIAWVLAEAQGQRRGTYTTQLNSIQHDTLGVL